MVSQSLLQNPDFDVIKNSDHIIELVVERRNRSKVPIIEERCSNADVILRKIGR